MPPAEPLYDVAIIGAGPVGATLAALLAAEGVPAAIIDVRLLGPHPHRRLGQAQVPADLRDRPRPFPDHLDDVSSELGRERPPRTLGRRQNC